MTKNLVLIFLKEAKAGFVKTRLAKDLGEDKTLELYKYFVKDLITNLKDTSYELRLCTYGNKDLIQETFGSYNSFAQEDGNLGFKMKSAFEKMFLESYDNVILIGSDTPHINKELIKQSFKILQGGKTVIGPSEDGGYYLIAFNKNFYKQKIFSNISWSTEFVLEQTLQVLNNDEVYLLKILNDIDTKDDLISFYKKYKTSYFSSSKTIKYLNNINFN